MKQKQTLIGFLIMLALCLETGTSKAFQPNLDLKLISGAGYVSGLFGKWHLGGGVTGPNDQGFDEHRGAITGSLPAYDSWDKYVNQEIPQSLL